MKRKHWAMALVVAVLLVAAVAGGVHVLNKKAHAIAYYKVHCLRWDVLDSEWRGIFGILVEITIGEEDPFPARTDVNGLISLSRDFSAEWTAEIIDAQGLGEPDDGDPYPDNPANLSQPLMQTWFWGVPTRR